MKTFGLKRIALTESGVFGVLLLDGLPFAVTLEDPWKMNTPNVSCIPPGAYICQRVQSPKFGETFEITNVPNRTHILFHRGNTPADTRGCVLVAESFDLVNGVPGIAASGQGFAEFMAHLEGEASFQVLITWA